MIKNDLHLAHDLIREDTLNRLMNENNIDIDAAKEYLNNMTFSEYVAFTEATLGQPTNAFSTIKPTYPMTTFVLEDKLPEF